MKNISIFMCAMCIATTVHAQENVHSTRAANAPEGFISVPANGAKDYKFSLQISEMDCTGCGSCVASCPMSEKALKMERVEKELTRWSRPVRSNLKPSV